VEPDRCGTALETPDGLVLIDPPALSAQDLALVERDAGPVRHVVLTSASHDSFASPFPEARVFIAGKDTLPGGLLPVYLPAEPALAGEAAVLAPWAGNGLLITGNVLPVVGQTAVYLEGVSPPMPVYLDAIKVLMASEPGALAPGKHGTFWRALLPATPWAGHLGSPSFARRAAPVEGPRFLMVQPRRALAEALMAPVVLRHSLEGGWLPDPYACARCGAPNDPMPQTCGGPLIPRLCPVCRQEERASLPDLRLMVCGGGCCTREGARAVASAARQALDERGWSDGVDVVQVSCLGECSLGPFVAVATARGAEPKTAQRYREQTVERARRYAADEGEVIDEESERVLARFAAQVQPAEIAQLVDVLAAERT
jgi:hypothetical protein